VVCRPYFKNLMTFHGFVDDSGPALRTPTFLSTIRLIAQGEFTRRHGESGSNVLSGNPGKAFATALRRLPAAVAGIAEKPGAESVD